MGLKKGPRFTLTKDGKALLKEAAERKGFGPSYLATECKCKHSLITQLFTSDESKGTKPVWSSHVVPKLCRLLEVPLWAVVEGLEETHRAILSALSLVQLTAPDRYGGFVQEMITRARDIAMSRGYVFRDDNGPGGPPPRGAGRSR